MNDIILYIIVIWALVGIFFACHYGDNAMGSKKIIQLILVSGPFVWVFGLIYWIIQMIYLSGIPKKVDSYFKTPSIKK